MVITEHWWEEQFTDSFVIIIKVFQNQQCWDCHENDCVPIVYLLLE
jgi:hypothetical protein